MTGDINSPPHQQSKDNLYHLSASVSYWFPWKVNITGNAGPSQEWPQTPHSLWFYLTPVISNPSAGMENGAFVLFNCCYCACRRVVAGWLKTGWEISGDSSVFVVDLLSHVFGHYSKKQKNKTKNSIWWVAIHKHFEIRNFREFYWLLVFSYAVDLIFSCKSPYISIVWPFIVNFKKSLTCLNSNLDEIWTNSTIVFNVFNKCLNQTIGFVHISPNLAFLSSVTKVWVFTVQYQVSSWAS